MGIVLSDQELRATSAEQTELMTSFFVVSDYAQAREFCQVIPSVAGATSQATYHTQIP